MTSYAITRISNLDIDCYPFVMPNIARIRVEWSGVVGGGLSTFYALEADAAAAYAAVRAFFDDIDGQVVPTITWSFPNVGDVLDSATGQITGSWTATQLSTVSGTASETRRAASVGVRVTWQTGAVIGGRRVRGATYITDLSIGAYENDGTLSSSALEAFRNAASDLAAEGVLLVWSRPGPNGSGTSEITSATVADRVTALRSRRF